MIFYLNPVAVRRYKKNGFGLTEMGTSHQHQQLQQIQETVLHRQTEKKKFISWSIVGTSTIEVPYFDYQGWAVCKKSGPFKRLALQ